MALASVAAVLFYVPAYFLQHVVAYLEADPGRTDRGWGWLFAAGLFLSNTTTQLGAFRPSAPRPLLTRL